MSYTPPREVLERYARLLVEYALGRGDGVRPGDVVLVWGTEDTKPLYVEVCRAVWRSGGHVIEHFAPANDEHFNLRRIFYDEASEEQLDFFPAKYERGQIDECDHLVYIHCERDPHALRDVSPTKVIRHQEAMRPAIEWQQEKEKTGDFSWTIGLYGSEGMAAEARMSLEEYWQQVVKACFLAEADPIARWRTVNEEIAAQCDWLNSLPIERLHVEGEDVDLWLTLGERRRWLGGSGLNIPSFEVFTSPDWRGTEGRIRFSEPLYLFGSLVTGIELEFREGRVVKASAEENEQLLKELVAAENGDRVGEFSLTDSRLSPIDRFMAATLFDENMGGPHGNTHIALGLSYQDTLDGDPTALTDADWEALGYNQAAVHTDIVSTTDRTVTAIMTDGGERVIYARGQFTLDS